MFKKATTWESSWLQDYINVSFKKLVETFGEPHSDGDGYKVDAEWNLKFDDGTYATIYNYKDGKNYCGEDGDEIEDITEWHIGGQTKNSVLKVLEALNS